MPVRKKYTTTQVDFATLAAALDIQTIPDSNGVWLTAKGARVYKLRTGNHWVLAGNTTQQLMLPVERTGNSYWTPLRWSIDALTAGSVEEAIFDSLGMVLTMRPGKVQWKGVSVIEQGSDSLELTIQLPPGPQINLEMADSLLTITVTGAKADTTEFIMDLPEVTGWRYVAYWEENPQRVVIHSARKLTGMKSDNPRLYRLRATPAVVAVKTSPKVVTKLASEQTKWAMNCVVIDAGHGGKDPGALGRGIQEKDVTLDIARRLRDELKKVKGLTVVMTRDSDVFVPLEERGRIANDKGGKLFVSIHVNSLRSSSARGIETYFLSPAKTNRALQVAEFENSVLELDAKSTGHKLTDEEYIVLSMAQSQFLKESQRLADLVQKSSVAKTGLPDRGVDQAGFYVLVGASMPAILFETGFLSNQSDSKVLRSDDGRQRYAEALFEAIETFRTEAEQNSTGKP